MTEITTTAVLGAGVIGASWTALFAAAGLDVRVYDVSETVESDVGDYVDRAWPTLLDLGLAIDGRKGSITFHDTAAEAVTGAGFVQENVPERLEIKHALFREIESHLPAEAIVSSSASGLMVAEMQKGWTDPSRFILGHPFNPPHLIPLVELLANDRTDDDVLPIAEDFYRAVGKVTIRVRREVPGHVANRLQAALWREAIHWSKPAWHRSKMSTRPYGPVPDCAGPRWDRTCCFTWGRVRVASGNSAIATPTASTAGGTTWVRRGSRTNWRPISLRGSWRKLPDDRSESSAKIGIP